MMGVIVFILFMGAFILARISVHDRISRITLNIYLGWWGMCLFVSTLDLFGIYSVSSFTYCLLLLNVFAFMIGFICAVRSYENSSAQVNYRMIFNSLNNELIKHKQIKLGLVFLFAYLFYYYRKFQTVLNVVSSSEARTLRFSAGELFHSVTEVLVYNLFVDAVAIFLITIVTSTLMLGRLRNWVFSLALVDLALYVSIGAGRTAVVEAGIFIALLASIRHVIQPPIGPTKAAGQAGNGLGEIPPRKNLLLFVALPVALLIAFSIYLTAFRTFNTTLDLGLAKAAGMLFLDQAQYYSTGAFRALDYSLSHIYLYGFHYGALTFGFVDEIIGYIMKILGIKYTILNQTIGGILDQDIYIGTYNFNALYTCVFRYYFDFGIPGVVVFSFGLGALMRRAIVQFNKFPCFATLSIYLFLFGVCFLSSQNWYLASSSSIVFLLTALMLYRLERKRWRVVQNKK
jgi:oligosaccharide repeat unit polymerase